MHLETKGMSKCIFICGEICSGKDTMIEICYAEYPYRQIDMGSEVRKKYQTVDRIFDSNLDGYLAGKVKEELDKDSALTYLITGVRQPTLLKMIAELFDEVEYNYLVVPRSILKERYLNRAGDKDANISFEDSIAGDLTLGMAELQTYLLTEVKCNFIKNY
jgi:hypothetical protein